ncbi:uncharacterized protein BJ171DRAFT_418314 [Polychytrium aggregatum]|uniref:uncharacterized protein n=1 Tax=Polychytrium aggregatum TaxID=110093 RepID=UPI0022FDF9A2|nr:uncharacterized protein BJ171DRAFT_418314 [Polychytrium aggregatum]KAI9209875.1 hypothetical protein BJ171DRAFT_418314 [Polychytrium aggregatum]
MAPGHPTHPTQRVPRRTTKLSQKLTVFPLAADDRTDDEFQEDELDDQLPHVSSKVRKEQWLSKLEKQWLPRVTAYCTANSYNMDRLYELLLKCKHQNGTAPKRFDEVIYTPYYFQRPTDEPLIDLEHDHESNDLDIDHTVGIHGPVSDPVESLGGFFEHNLDVNGRAIPQTLPRSKLAKRIAPVGECFFFDYGVVVFWGLTEKEEKRLLQELSPFEEDKLVDQEVETEEFHFHYNPSHLPRIYNDIITLRSPSTMVKLTISHAIAQSAKMALFEELIENTIEGTKMIPQIMAETGKIHMSRKAINQKIGQLFVMRINVNLVSNVLDTPEIFWSEPALEPLYIAIRGYLEISQRVDLLNQRVAVISDLLDMLKEHLNSFHGEQLEWIVITLIAFEIIIGLVTISFDLTSYLQNRDGDLY